MELILQRIQEDVMAYAEVMAGVIGVDVEIMDQSFRRIAGTGIYRERVGLDMAAEGLIYQAAISSGVTQIVENPGEHPLCQGCPHCHRCDEKLEICTPIRLEEKTIGIIGLICFTEAQREHVWNKLSMYSSFLEQMAGFIGSKAAEQRESERQRQLMELLNQVLDRMGSGVLILDKENRLVHLNAHAQKQLGLGEEWQGCEVELQLTGDSLHGWEEARLTAGGRTLRVMSEILPVMPSVAEYDRILVIRDWRTIRDDVYHYSQFSEQVTIENILGGSQAMMQLRESIRRVAAFASTVLITGESGTGKELVARAVHAASRRAEMPFVALNCGAIPEPLLESELFGYVKGAFTGADPKGRIGKFELAHKGTLFLDEIGDMPLYLQVKLLRVLQERTLCRVGSNQQVAVDVRIVAATNKNLEELIRENQFREDLYYRLNVIPLRIPPLRERFEDIRELAEALVRRYTLLFGKTLLPMEESVWELFRAYNWPGNVRELENTLEYMINMAEDGGKITADLVPVNLRKRDAVSVSKEFPTLEMMEKQLIQQALACYGHSTEGKKLAAQHLGIGLATLYRKLEKDGKESFSK